MTTHPLCPSVKDRLLRLRGNSILEIAIHNATRTHLPDAIKLVISCHEDNPQMMQELLGADLIADIITINTDSSEPAGAYAD